MTGPQLRFDDVAHEYWLGDRRLPNVTSVLQAENFTPSHEWVDPWYLERGAAIHRATELYDKGVLDEGSVDPRIRGYVESYKKFLHTPYAGIELRLCDPIAGYAGTLDRLTVDGVLIDIKSGTAQAWHVFQLGGYFGLCKGGSGGVVTPIVQAHSLLLQKDGSPPKVGRVYTLADLIDARQTFLCALRVHNAKSQMGLGE